MTADQTHALIEAVITLITVLAAWISNRNRQSAAQHAAQAAEHAEDARGSAANAAASIKPPAP